MASKNKTTITTRTQDTITQRDLELLAIAQYQLASWTATCQRLEGQLWNLAAFLWRVPRLRCGHESRHLLPREHHRRTIR